MRHFAIDQDELHWHRVALALANEIQRMQMKGDSRDFDTIADLCEILRRLNELFGESR